MKIFLILVILNQTGFGFPVTNSPIADCECVECIMQEELRETNSLPFEVPTT